LLYSIVIKLLQDQLLQDQQFEHYQFEHHPDIYRFPSRIALAWFAMNWFL